jgi:hypothetical protein
MENLTTRVACSYASFRVAMDRAAQPLGCVLNLE